MNLETLEPISGIANCHIKGVHSLVFRRWRGGGMLRAFITVDGHGLKVSDGLPLAPHDHRFRIGLKHLCGDVQHHRFSEGDGERFVRHQYVDALRNGEAELKPIGVVRMREVVAPLGKREILAESEVHTITVASEFSAWLVFEGTERQQHNALYHREECPQLDFGGLYKPMLADECWRLWREVLRAAKK